MLCTWDRLIAQWQGQQPTGQETATRLPLCMQSLQEPLGALLPDDTAHSEGSQVGVLGAEGLGLPPRILAHRPEPASKWTTATLFTRGAAGGCQQPLISCKGAPCQTEMHPGQGPEQQDGKPCKASRAAATTILLYWALPPQQEHMC